METKGVVIGDVIDDFQPSRCSGWKSDSVQPLGLQASEKALGGRIIPAIAFAAHARNHAIVADPVLVIMASILASSVGMMKQAGQRFSAPKGHRQSIECELLFDPFIEGPADNLTRKQVHDHSQVQPAFERPDIADVCRPDLVGLFDVEVALKNVWCHWK